MRIIPAASLMIVVGVLGSLPFRRVDPTIQSPIGAATGPLAPTMEEDSVGGVMQWPDRPGFDPSLAWQPQPMKLDARAYTFDMPAMPDAFPIDAVDVPIPSPIRDRYDAVVDMRKPAIEVGDIEPSVVPALPSSIAIQDRFVYTPPEPTATSPTVQASPMRPVSTVRVESSADVIPGERQYIREPS